MRIWIILMLTCSLLSGYAMTVENKIVCGYVEKATLLDNLLASQKSLTLSAKLDTGAKSASLSAININQIEKEGKTYLVFTVPSKQGNIEFMSEYVGKVAIKIRAEEHTHIPHERLKRPVVLIRVRLGNVERVIPVNLTNRKRFIYPLLLGRDAINAFNGLIDPARAFILKNEAASPL